MLARVFSCAVIGLDGVVVEVDTGGGFPHLVIVGLLDTAVKESREWVKSAAKNAGFYYPRRRITVNLAPTSVRKEGPAYDLPIAVGELIATNQLGPWCASYMGGRREKIIKAVSYYALDYAAIAYWVRVV